jgi:uncharacterized OB-fold protein
MNTASFDDFGRAFFEGAARGQLMVTRCLRCGAWSWPGGLASPSHRTWCPACLSPELEWQASAGRGTLFTFTRMHSAPDPTWSGPVPYVVAVVELAEGPRLVSTVVDSEGVDLRIGMSLEVAFDEVSDGVVLPVFRPTQPARGEHDVRRS